MPGSATDYLRQRVLGHTLGFTAYTMPATVYVTLCTTAPTATSAGTEVSGGGYTRMTAIFALVAGRTDQAANVSTIEWTPATTAWGAIGWFELRDAVSAGNRLYWGPLVDPADMVTPIIKNIGVADIFRLPAASMVVQAT